MAIERRSSSDLLVHGIIGGIVAGIVFAIFEMAAAATMGLSFFDPVRLIASLAIGTQALSPAFPLATAVITGLVVHLVLSAVYGVIFVYLLALTNQISTSVGLLLLFGTIFGLALWVVNFLIIAPIFWPQFTMVDQFWNGFVAHTFFYGTVIGWYVSAFVSGRAWVPTK
ncbi:MAG: hypothetical protein HY675_13390 [Chloroflexi bacterium]|nr:hypothetical protein [Chloroflexota bacterium]